MPVSDVQTSPSSQGWSPLRIGLTGTRRVVADTDVALVILTRAVDRHTGTHTARAVIRRLRRTRLRRTDFAVLARGGVRYGSASQAPVVSLQTPTLHWSSSPEQSTGTPVQTPPSSDPAFAPYPSQRYRRHRPRTVWNPLLDRPHRHPSCRCTHRRCTGHPHPSSPPAHRYTHRRAVIRRLGRTRLRGTDVTVLARGGIRYWIGLTGTRPGVAHTDVALVILTRAVHRHTGTHTARAVVRRLRRTRLRRTRIPVLARRRVRYRIGNAQAPVERCRPRRCTDRLKPEQSTPKQGSLSWLVIVQTTTSSGLKSTSIVTQSEQL